MLLYVLIPGWILYIPMMMPWCCRAFAVGGPETVRTVTFFDTFCYFLGLFLVFMFFLDYVDKRVHQLLVSLVWFVDAFKAWF